MLIDMNKECICHSGLAFEVCCEPFLLGKEQAQSALALMRSRYSAYVLKNGQYLYDTCSSRLQNIEDIKAIEQDQTVWIGLKILSYNDEEVTFMAYFKETEGLGVMKEHSYFLMEEGRLRYDRGELLNAQISRNEPCPCGSGKKYKQCCAKGNG